MVEDAALGGVGVHIGGVPGVGDGGLLRPDTVVVTFADISLGTEDGTVARGGVDEDCIGAVAEGCAWGKRLERGGVVYLEQDMDRPYFCCSCHSQM